MNASRNLGNFRCQRAGLEIERPGTGKCRGFIGAREGWIAPSLFRLVVYILEPAYENRGPALLTTSPSHRNLDLHTFSHSTPASRSVSKILTGVFRMKIAYRDCIIHIIQHAQECRKTRVFSPCDGHER